MIRVNHAIAMIEMGDQFHKIAAEVQVAGGEDARTLARELLAAGHDLEVVHGREFARNRRGRRSFVKAFAVTAPSGLRVEFGECEGDPWCGTFLERRP